MLPLSLPGSRLVADGRRLQALVKFKVSKVLIFRAEMLVWILLSFLPFAILFLIWQEIYAGQQTIYEYDLPDITTYYLIGLILANVTEVHFEGWRSEEIRLGTIDRYLTKPYHYLTEVILGESVGKTLYAILFLPLFALFALWAYQTTGVGHVVLNATTLLSFLFVAFCAYLIQLGLGIFITLLTFWFEGAQGLEHFKWLSITLLSGTLMPLEFLPEWLQHLTSALPFKYLYAVPIGVMQGRYELGISDLGNIVITLSLLGFAIAILWKKGIKHYCSAGG